MTTDAMLMIGLGVLALVAVVMLVRTRRLLEAQRAEALRLEHIEAKASELERQHHTLGQLINDYLAFMRDLHGADALR